MTCVSDLKLRICWHTQEHAFAAQSTAESALANAFHIRRCGLQGSTFDGATVREKKTFATRANEKSKVRKCKSFLVDASIAWSCCINASRNSRCGRNQTGSTLTRKLASRVFCRPRPFPAGVSKICDSVCFRKCRNHRFLRWRFYEVVQDEKRWRQFRCPHSFCCVHFQFTG